LEVTDVCPEGYHQYCHSCLTQTHIISNENADICDLHRFNTEGLTKNGVEACEFVPTKVQWNDVRIVVRIIKECGFLPDNKACLMSESIEMKGEVVCEA
jgi:hypothetical protein